MMEVFYWIGVVVSGLAALGGSGFAALWVYFRLLHDRFHIIPFRKGQRRLSLASWHSSKVTWKGDDRGNLEGFDADDWPIGLRPFYLSYRINKGRRAFIMMGTMDRMRWGPIKGARHP